MSEATTDVQHVDYPHTPGTLYDCHACESQCHCESGFVCVGCADLQEAYELAGGE